MTVKAEFSNFSLPDGNHIYFEYRQREDAHLTVVFLNGLSQSTQAWSAIEPEIRNNASTLLLDLVFQGRSGEKGEFRTYDQHAEDVRYLINALGIKNALLCGISYGSAVAQHSLVNYPDMYSGAVLLSTFGNNHPHFTAIGDSWISALNAGGYDLMLDVMLPVVLGRTYFANPLIPVETLKSLRTSQDLKKENLLKLMEATRVRGNYLERLKEIRKPIWVIQGEEDLLTTTEMGREVASAVNAVFIEVPKSGHTLNLEAIPLVSQYLKKILQELDQ